MDASERRHIAGHDLERHLIAAGVRKAHLRSARRLADFSAISLDCALHQLGLASSEQLARALAASSGLRYVSFVDLMAHDYRSVGSLRVGNPLTGLPMELRGHRLRIAVADPDSEIAADFMAYELERCIASTRALRHAYRRTFAQTERTYRELSAEIRTTTTADHALFPRMLVALLRHACYTGASDLQIHLIGEVGLVRLVVDGVGHTFDVLSAKAVESLYNVTLRSTGKNEDQLQKQIFGEASFAEAGLSDEVVRREFEELRNEYDFRMNFGRAKGGLTLTVRFLARDAETQEFEQLGFDAADQSTILRALASNSGLVVVTGPTGSSKTTTRYAMLSRIDPEERSIQTIENPVEYTHPMWMQYEIKSAEEEDVGTEKVFRGMLRNAPRVVDVAEVRSPGTVATMMRAAATGHLVFTTLHADDAALAVYMLRTLGVSDQDLATNLQIVIGVRLARRLCPSCRRREDRAQALSQALELAEEAGESISAEHELFAASEGCSHCTNGYRGRFLLYELMEVRADVAKLLREGADVRRVRQAAIEKGKSLRDRGWHALREGKTTIDELWRVLPRRRY
jgi:type II secretory ATPase GspE/PulE/Tfp pilus assembly ATPase PilB-like protein